MTNYKYITDAATTTFKGNETVRVLLHGIFVNKILTGALSIQSGSTVLGLLTAATPIGTYFKSEKGILIENLTIVNASAENVTVEYSNI